MSAPNGNRIPSPASDLPPLFSVAWKIFQFHSIYQTGTPSNSLHRFTLPLSIAASSSAARVIGEDQQEPKTINEIKSLLYKAVDGINRGIFGVTSSKKSEIEGLVEMLESMNPTPYPTDDLRKVEGSWRLVYSTITILGAKRTKLGLRDFITLGEFFQTLDVANGKAINRIEFHARGFKMISGQLTIKASYQTASRTRVNIKLESSSITPDQLKSLFEKNYNLLLAIFNPEGWLELTYIDESMRIGRDDKGHIFVLQRSERQIASR